jgi:hypothetical protein
MVKIKNEKRRKRVRERERDRSKDWRSHTHTYTHGKPIRKFPKQCWSYCTSLCWIRTENSICACVVSGLYRRDDNAFNRTSLHRRRQRSLCRTTIVHPITRAPTEHYRDRQNGAADLPDFNNFRRFTFVRAHGCACAGVEIFYYCLLWTGNGRRHRFCLYSVPYERRRQKGIRI